jgi:hypothetical protein
LLEALHFNGGPTETTALTTGSPAIDAADFDAPTRDQRNFLRAGVPDIGAFEYRGTQPVRLANISSRANVGTSNNVLIGGFIVTGKHDKAIVLRAVGPSLTLPGALSNPTLELHDGTGALIAHNDDWQGATNQADIFATGIAPTNALESAILVSLTPGAYTAIVKGVSDATGPGLVEVYDLDSTVDSKLANIAARGFVQSGDDVLIGGFIVAGPDSDRIIFRALGPSLPLADNSSTRRWSCTTETVRLSLPTIIGKARNRQRSKPQASRPRTMPSRRLCRRCYPAPIQRLCVARMIRRVSRWWKAMT